MISVAGLDLPAAWHSLQDSATAVGYFFSTWLYCLIINVCMALFWNREVLHLTASHVSFIRKKVLESLCEKAARQSKLGDVCHRPVSFIFFIIILVHLYILPILITDIIECSSWFAQEASWQLRRARGCVQGQWLVADSFGVTHEPSFFGRSQITCSPRATHAPETSQQSSCLKAIS